MKMHSKMTPNNFLLYLMMLFCFLLYIYTNIVMFGIHVAEYFHWCGNI